MKKLRIVVVMMICLVASTMCTGCGVKHNSPEGVVRSLVKYSEKGKLRKVLDCYGLKKDEDKTTQAEVEAVIKYYETMRSKGITLVDCGIIKAYKRYNYVYISYTIDLGNDKAYPKIETYYVKENEDEFYVVPSNGVSEKMSKAAETEYATFMLTDAYKEYQKSYDAFMLKNPSFEEELATKLQG